MPKNTKSLTLHVFHIPVLIIVGAVVLSAVAFKTMSTPDQEAVLGKGTSKGNSANAKGQAKKVDTANIKSINAKQHKDEVIKVTKKLQDVANKEETVENVEVAAELEEVIVDAEDTVDEVALAIDEVEKKPKWQVLLFGSDYKNLGALRSHLAHNTNAIRKLLKASDDAVDDTSSTEIQTQLEELLQERERISSVIEQHEDQFSILGRVFRFLNGYLGGGLPDDLGDYIDDIPESTESTESTETN